MNQSPRHSTVRPPATVILAAACLAPLGGCLEQTNDLLNVAPLPALAGNDEPGTSSLRTGTPSLSNSSDDPWDRSDWNRVEVLIPAASVRHEPTYTGRPLPPGGKTTAGREVPADSFPTTTTALVVTTDGGIVIGQAVLAPFDAVLDLVASPVRMFLSPPWSVLEEPTATWMLLPEKSTDSPVEFDS